MEKNFFSELQKMFEKFPGIGPRQAARFIWALSDLTNEEQERFGALISSLNKNISRCAECLRVFNKNATDGTSAHTGKGLCSFCALNSKRDRSKIMILEKDSDFLNVEKSGIYNGLYHVLGGVIDPLAEETVARERIKKLYNRLNMENRMENRTEIILALSPTKLGEFTANYVERVLEPLINAAKLKITRLGRGLAAGTDLEYADAVTLREALNNRK